MHEPKNVLDLDLLDDSAYQEKNWAEFVDKDELHRLGSEIVEDVQRDARSRKAWMDEMDMWLDMASQVIESKDTPWEGASNIKFPLLPTAALQFHARAQGELMKGDKLVKAKVIGADANGEKADRCKRVGSAMSTQLLYEMEDWQDDTDRLLFILPLVGTVFRKAYWSATVGRPVSELVLPSDLIVNYWATDWERCRKTHSFLKPRNEIEESMRLGTYIECTLPDVAEMPKEDADPKDTEAPDSEDAGADFDPKDIPFTLYECHYWWDLDGDGYAEPYIITVLKDTAKVVRIVPRFDLSRIDSRPDDDGEEFIARIRSYEYVIPYKFLPDIDSSIYGVGFGKLIGPTGAAVDTLINVLMDSGVLSTMPSGFFGRGLRVSRGGSVRLKPGEWRRVNVTGEDLQKNFYPLPTKEPSTVLFQLLGMLIQAGEQIGSSTQTMKGENPGQNTPSRTFNDLQESGMQVFLGIYKRIYRSLTKEYRTLGLLNYMHLSQDAYEALLDEYKQKLAEAQQKQQEAQMAAAAAQQEGGGQPPQPPTPIEPPQPADPRADFDPEGLDIVPQADPNLENSWRKKQRSQQLIEARNAGMPLNDKLITKLYLESIEEPNIEEMMQVADPPPSEAELNHQVKMAEVQLKQQEMQMTAHLRQYEPMKDMASAREHLAKAQSLAGEEQKAQLDIYIKQIEAQMRQAESQQRAFLDMMLMDKKMEVEDAKVRAHEARTQNMRQNAGS